MSERVMSEMLSEQSAPEGAKKWYSRPAIVMHPAQANAWRGTAHSMHAFLGS